MNREIKFRGKSNVDIGEKIIQKGDWVYGGIAFDTDRVWIDTPYIGQVIVDDNTIGQFTGLHDKNGEEIYEGDIIERTTLSGKKYRFSVEYSNKYAQYIITNTRDMENEAEPLGDYENIEVIGNVFENGDILNDSKNTEKN